LRLELSEADNPFDKQKFEETVLVNLKRKYSNQENKGKDNISKANRFFSDKKQINTANHCHIFREIANNFYFSLMIVDKEAEVGELFMTLNKTALNLTIPDLVKSLFVTREISKEQQQKISQR
jgi:hypothetical protein